MICEMYALLKYDLWDASAAIWSVRCTMYLLRSDLWDAYGSKKNELWSAGVS